MKQILKKIYLKLYNRKHKVIIKSIHASLSAKYDIGVLIDTDTIVESNVKIGKYSYVNKRSSVENCEIGAFCSISSGVYINPYEHDLSVATTHPVGQKCNSMNETNRRVIIGNDVLISLNVIILDGVTIGDGAVIAAGAVVTEDVKPYEIVGGVPAKHIGFRADEEVIQQMLRIQWWNWPDEEIKHNSEDLQKKISVFAASQIGKISDE